MDSLIYLKGCHRTVITYVIRRVKEKYSFGTLTSTKIVFCLLMHNLNTFFYLS